jgi:hypothetical protein
MLLLKYQENKYESKSLSNHYFKSTQIYNTFQYIVTFIILNLILLYLNAKIEEKTYKINKYELGL